MGPKPHLGPILPWLAHLSISRLSRGPARSAFLLVRSNATRCSLVAAALVTDLWGPHARYLFFTEIGTTSLVMCRPARDLLDTDSLPRSLPSGSSQPPCSFPSTLRFACAYELLRRAHRVVGISRFPPRGLPLTVYKTLASPRSSVHVLLEEPRRLGHVVHWNSAAAVVLLARHHHGVPMLPVSARALRQIGCRRKLSLASAIAEPSVGVWELGRVPRMKFMAAPSVVG
jgi:hypothetical protein